MKLIVKVTKEAEGRYRAWCANLPGCFVRGKTYPEAWQKIDRAIRGYLASMNVSPPQLRAYLMTA